jgi:hypothetical protein
MAQAPHLLLWQPLLKGKLLAQQFLRLKAAAQLADGGGKAILDAARADLARGQPVDIAGYPLHPALFDALQAATLTPPATTATATTAANAANARHLVWLELSSQSPSSMGAPSQAALQQWRDAGWHVTAEALAGPPFWQTVEIEDAPALIEATTRHIGTAAAMVPA